MGDGEGWYYDVTDTGLPDEARWQIDVCFAEDLDDADDQIGESASGPRGPFRAEADARDAAEYDRWTAERSEELDKERKQRHALGRA